MIGSVCILLLVALVNITLADKNTILFRDTNVISSIEFAPGPQLLYHSKLEIKDYDEKLDIVLPMIVPNKDNISGIYAKVKDRLVFGVDCITDIGNNHVDRVLKLLQEPEYAENNSTCILFNLNNLKGAYASETIDFIATISWIGTAKPLPPKLKLEDSQFLSISLPALINFPTADYEIEQIKHLITFPNSNVKSFGIFDYNSLSGEDRIDHGFDDIFTISGKMGTMLINSSQIKIIQKKLLFVHFEYSSPYLVAPTLHREVDISHITGIVTITDYLTVENRGPELEIPFSRIDYMLKGYTYKALARNIVTSIPKTAFNIDFRDDVGNVTTSLIKNEKDGSSLIITPRFPLVAGWKYKYYQSYQVPLGDAIKLDSYNGVYQAIIPALPKMAGIPFYDVEIDITLPQGVGEPRALVEFKYDSTTERKKYSYFDTTGRTVINLKLHNIINFEIYPPIKISYSYPVMYVFMEKVTIVSLFVYVFFIIVSFSSRIDLSSSWTYSKIKETKKE